MERIFHSKFCEFYLDKEKSLLRKIWTKETEFMNEFELRNILNTWKDTIIKCRIKYFILDTRDFLFSLSPPLQTWIANEIMAPAVASGLEKMATILPEEDVFVQISVEESMDENLDGAGLPSSAFSDLDDAKSWLLSN